MSQAKSVRCSIVVAILFALAQSQGQTLPTRASAPAPVSHVVDFPIVIRFSERFLSLLISPQVIGEEPVNLVVLGTPTVGTAWLEGKLRLDLKPAPRGVSLFACFDGTCVSRTTGRNGPAIIYGTATTSFSAQKPLRVDVDQGIEAGETTMTARTSVVTPCIESTLPRLRGRIVRRVARRRVQRNQPQIIAIARSRARARIGRAFDSSVEGLVVQFNGDLDLLRPVIQRLREENPDSSLVFSTTEDYLELAIGRAESRNLPELPATVFDLSPVQVWLHRSSLGDGRSTAKEQLASIQHTVGRIEQQLVERFRSRAAILALLRRAPIILGSAGDWVVIGLATENE